MTVDLGSASGKIVIDTRGVEEGLLRGGNAMLNFQSVATGVGTAVGAIAVGMGAAMVGVGAAAFGMASDIQTATSNIQAELGLTVEETERLGDIAVDVWKNNFTGSIEEAAQVVSIVRQQLGDLSDNELQDAAENAQRIADVFDNDVSENVEAARILMEEFGLTQQEAFDFITTGFQGGLNASDDFLDSITEYSTQFSNAGADAGEFFSLLDSGLAGGMLGTDKAADLFKEFRLRMTEGADGAREALKSISGPTEDIIGAIESGELSVAEAFEMIKDRLSDLDDPIEAQRLGIELMGTQFEDLGTDAVLALTLTNDALADSAGATDTLDAKYNNLGDVVEGYKRRAMAALIPIGDALMSVANEILPIVEDGFAFFEANVVPVLQGVGEFIAEFVRGLQATGEPLSAIEEALDNFLSEDQLERVFAFNDGLRDFIARVQEVLAPILAAVGEFVSWKDVLIVLAGALLTVVVPAIAAVVASMAPILLAVGAVIGIVALLRNAWENNWGDIQGKTAAALDFINNIITTVMTAVQDFWAANGEQILSIAQGIWESIVFVVNLGLENMKTIFAAFKLAFEGDWAGFGETLRVAWDRSWEAIKTILANLWASFRPILANFINNILGIFANTDWGALGRSIIDGLVNAINNGAQAVINAVLNIAASAEDAIKGFFGIESPSKMFEEIGQFLNQGLILGLEDTTGIERAVQRSMEAVMPAAVVNQQFIPSTAIPGATTVNLFGGQSFPNVQNGQNVVSELQDLST